MHKKTIGLYGLQARARGLQDTIQSILRKLVSCNGSVILYTQDKHATFGIGKGSDVFRNLIPHSAAITRTFGLTCAFVQRLAIKVLTFVLIQKRRDVES